jgi:hypothetical protein
MDVAGRVVVGGLTDTKSTRYGRKMYRSEAGDISYVPQNARCILGTLTATK